MKPPDWNAVVEELITAAKGAIKDFAEAHPDETVSYFGFDANPPYGSVLISIDTLDNSIRAAKEISKRFLQTWRPKAKANWSSHYLLSMTHSQATPFFSMLGDFSYMGYRELEFPEWQQYIQTTEPDEANPRADSPEQYIEAQASRAMFLALDSLVKTRTLQMLRLSERCCVGFATHDSPQTITTHVLNWPDP